MFKGTLYPYQEEAVHKMVDRGQMLLGITMGGGKMQPLDEPVLTPKGWLPIGKINNGDYVIGVDGLAHRVVAIFNHYNKQMFKVTFNDGTWTKCGGEHLWEVSPVWNSSKQIVMSTNDILSSGIKDAAGNNKYHIPLVSPVEFVEEQHILDPYLLGLLIGDGGFSTKSSVVFTTADTELLQSVYTLIPEHCTIRQKSKYDFSIKGTVHRINPMLNILRSLGLQGTNSYTKFIPPTYLLGTSAQRLALLQGLLDTDGSPKENGGAEFGTVSPYLRDAVMELVQSLGGIARLGKQREHKNGPSWRIHIKMPLGVIPFRLPRKRTLYKVPTKYPVSRLISSIEPSDYSDARCLTVDSPRHLYVTRNYIVTHNTVTTIAAVEQLFDKDEIDRCLVIVPSSLKYQWKREIEKFTDSKVTVIDGTPTARERLWKTCLSTKYVVVNPESLIRDALILKRYTWQAMIIDEATIIKARTSKRSKFLKKISKPIPYRFALTGQPIENKPEELFSIMEFVDPSVLGDFREFDRTFIVRDHFGRPTRYKNLKTLHKSLSECLIRKTREEIADQLPKIIYQVIPVPFDTKGGSLYRFITNDLLHQLQQAINAHGGGFNLWRHYNDTASNEAQGQIMSRLTVLRMLCDNPELLRISADNFSNADTKSGSMYAYDLVSNNLVTTYESPKLDAVLDYIENILDEDPANKIVLFSFFKHNLKLIQKALNRLTTSVLFTGDMNSDEKDAAKQRFSADPSVRVFLSSDAGGYGVDLPMANYLISYDLPWSSGKLEQREARIIRLSSTFSHVTIATFVMQGSIEERQYDMLQHKKQVNEAFVDGRHHDIKGGMDITLSTLTTFLRTSNV